MTGNTNDPLENRVFRSVKIQTENRLPIPKNLRPTITDEYDNVYWNYEQNLHLPIVSDKRLEKPPYTPLKKSYTLHNETRITVPQTIREISGFPFNKGDIVYLHGMEQMLTEGRPHCLYILTERKVWSLIERQEDFDFNSDDLDPDADREEILRQTVLKTAPAFLPPP